MNDEQKKQSFLNQEQRKPDVNEDHGRYQVQLHPGQCEQDIQVDEKQPSTKITRIFDLLGGAKNNAVRIEALSRSINAVLLGPGTSDEEKPVAEETEMGLLDRILVSLYDTQAILSGSIGRLGEVTRQLKL